MRRFWVVLAIVMLFGGGYLSGLKRADSQALAEQEKVASNFNKWKARAEKSIPTRPPWSKTEVFRILEVRNLSQSGADVVLYEKASYKECYGRVWFNDQSGDELRVYGCYDPLSSVRTYPAANP